MRKILTITGVALALVAGAAAPAHADVIRPRHGVCEARPGFTILPVLPKVCYGWRLWR